MSGEITGLCRDHSFEPAAELCRLCGGEFCDTCLVHPAGKVLCKACAIAAGGVRSSGAHKPLSKRDLRTRLKAFETARALKRAPEENAPIVTDPLVGHDPIGPPTGEGMDRLGEPDADVAMDPDLVAEAAAQLAGVGPAAKPTPAEESPGSDVAPAIDWNRPFS